MGPVEIEFERVGPTDPDAVALAEAMTDEGHRTYADRGLVRAQPLDELLHAGDRVLIGRVGLPADRRLQRHGRPVVRARADR
jgi:hypothetical protein